VTALPPSAPDAPDAAAVWKRVVDALSDAGVDQDTLASAAAKSPDAVALLIARHLVFPGERRYTATELHAKTGVDEETARALWRAMGFALVPDDEPAFTDADQEALEVSARLFDRAGMDRSVVLQQARSMGQAVARIASSHQDVIAEIADHPDIVRAAAESITLAEEALPALDRLLVYMYRRHLAAAIEQRMLMTRTEEGAVGMSVGFADMVRYTSLSQELPARELASLIERFNAATSDVVSQGGGRIIKTIGDEVMFATHEPGSAASVALTLLDVVSEEKDLPPLKVGIAGGDVITREGDVFGPPVNLASRLVAIAKPDSVLVDPATADALSGDERFHLAAVGKRYLKGLGQVRSFRLRPAASPRARSARRR
jgi:adenylate cyclase